MKTRDKYSYFIKNNKSYINAIGLMSGTSLDGVDVALIKTNATNYFELKQFSTCLLYTSPSPRDQRGSRMPSSA